MPKSPAPPPLHQPLGTILGTRAKVDILRVLTARGAPLSQRELARRADVTLRSAQAALADLYAMGVATKLAGGRDHLTDLNPQHILAPTLIALFSAEAELARNMRTAIAAAAAGDKHPPLGLYLFGSVARAEETLDSDLDILLVARDDSHRGVLLDRTLAGAKDLHSRYGVTVAPIAYTIREAKRGWEAGSAPWPELARDAVTLMGPPLGDLLR
ncbi:MAG: nucleotidyltransferase domain-containing protein [Gemmatimonas sp.]